jgi:hypothetical protein
MKGILINLNLLMNCYPNTSVKIRKNKFRLKATFLIFPDIYYYTKYINMGRKAKLLEEKKGKLSITISIDNFNKMESENVNKSQLINWLLEQHFNTINNGN